MNMRKSIKIFSLAGLVAVLFTSCLKDDAITDYSDSAIKAIILVPNGNYPRSSATTPLALDFTTEPYELRVYARVSWDKPLSKAIEVTFKEDTAAITAYRTKFGGGWVKMNSTAYQVTSLKVTIPAGQQEAYLPVKVFPDKVNLAQNNMLAFTITDASGENISSNYQTFVTPFLIKNIYDADYTVTGFFFHPSSPRSINTTKHLYTVSDVRSQAGANGLAGVGDLGGWYFRFDVAGTALNNWEAAGSTPAAPASGFFTADNPGGIAYPGPELPGTAPYQQTTYNNTYDAGNKTFMMHYGYGSGSTGPNGWTRNIYEKWVRK